MKELRKSLNWSKQELADYLGVNSRTVRRWESGESRPSHLAMKGILNLERCILSGNILPKGSEKPHNGRRGLLQRLVDRLIGGR